MEENLAMRTKKLGENAQVFETIVNQIMSGVQIRKPDDCCTLIYINSGFTAITGYTQEDIDTVFDGKFISLIYPADRDFACNKMIEQLNDHGHFSLEYRLNHKNNEIIWILDQSSFLLGDNGEKTILSVLTNITEQKKQQTALLISEKRYEIAMQASGITMFEYNILTKELILLEHTAKMYGLEKVIPNGSETFVKQGIIEPDSIDAYNEMYRQIHAGIPFAECYINTRDVDGNIHNFQLMLTNVFDDAGDPIRAIGVRKNVSQIMQLQKENEFIKTLMATKTLFCEADLSKNKILYLHSDWSNKNNIPINSTYTELIRIFIKKSIFSDHQSLVRMKLSVANIMKSFEQGETMISFNFKSNHEKDTYLWYTCILNIIKDLGNGNLTMRLYYENINENKLIKQQIYKERNFYYNMVKEALCSYEVNITKNCFIKGHEYWHNLYHLNESNEYDTLIDEFTKKVVYPEDITPFLNIFNRKKIYNAFFSGKRQLSCEYRKIKTKTSYQWIKSTLHMYKDNENNDIKGFIYVEDIDKQKRNELLLKYNAEHDMMTDLYNRATTQEKIKASLNCPSQQDSVHAFFIIDIDYFKNINDTFGHIYGDEVLKEIAQKLRSNFREDDIIGRFGGDEFCIFMKNIPSELIVEKKASSICDKIKKIYTNDEKSSAISASIGIALYNQHGKNYEELYNAADIALYKSKQSGRNCYTIYTPNKK